MSDIEVTGEPLREALDLKLEVVGLPVSDVDWSRASIRGWGGGWTPTSSAERTSGSCS